MLQFYKKICFYKSNYIFISAAEEFASGAGGADGPGGVVGLSGPSGAGGLVTME